MRVCPDCGMVIYFVEGNHAECIQCGAWVSRSESGVLFTSLLWRTLYKLRYLVGGIGAFAALVGAIVAVEYLQSHPMHMLRYTLCVALVWVSLPYPPLIYKDFDSCANLRIKSSMGLRMAFASLSVSLSVAMLIAALTYGSIYSTDLFDDPIAWLTIILIFFNAAVVPIAVWKNWTRAITSTHDYKRLKGDLLKSHRATRERSSDD
jgi:hypothetical protein